MRKIPYNKKLNLTSDFTMKFFPFLYEKIFAIYCLIEQPLIVSLSYPLKLYDIYYII